MNSLGIPFKVGLSQAFERREGGVPFSVETEGSFEIMLVMVCCTQSNAVIIRMRGTEEKRYMYSMRNDKIRGKDRKQSSVWKAFLLAFHPSIFLYIIQ